MKTALLTLIITLACSTPGIAGSADTETEPVAPCGYPLQFLSLLDVLYFNQTIDFALPAHSGVSVDHIEFKRGTAEITPFGFRLNVAYANISGETDDLKVYLKDAEGGTHLAYSKTVTIKQKLSEGGGRSVADDNDLFILGNQVVPLENTSPKEMLLQADQLLLRNARFTQDGLNLQGFDINIATSTGNTFMHSDDGKISSAMKSVIAHLNQGDKVSITNLVATYQVAGQSINMNLNYTLNFKIGEPN